MLSTSLISEDSGVNFISVLEHSDFLDTVILKLSLAGMMFSESVLPQYFTSAMLIGLTQTTEVILLLLDD